MEENKESAGFVTHCLAENSPNCPKCGASPYQQEVKNYNLDWHDGDVYCKCGAYVRMYDAG